jgi:hypothetical protein
MYYDNSSFQSGTFKELIKDIIEYNIDNDIRYFDAGNITVIYDKNNNFKEKVLCQEVVDAINEKGQQLLDQEFKYIKDLKADAQDEIDEYWENIQVRKRGFGILEGAIVFTILAFIGGVSQALIEYHDNPISEVSDCCN